MYASRATGKCSLQNEDDTTKAQAVQAPNCSDFNELWQKKKTCFISVYISIIFLLYHCNNKHNII